MKKLVIVESPTKTKKLSAFLGNEYEVLSSVGHIADLPKSKLGVDEESFEPEYVVNDKKKDVVRKLKKAAKESDTIFLATDQDREGEAIAWHVSEVLNNRKPLVKSDDHFVLNKLKNKEGKNPKVLRITFNSITKDAVLKAFEIPRSIDFDMVDAQQARRILDRLVGYKLSPLLWSKIRYGLSAGRVQSVGVRLIIERENDINKFPNEPYYEINALFETESKEKLEAKLSRIEEKTVNVKQKFKLFTGEYTATKTIIDTEDKANKYLAEIKKGDYKIESLKQKETKKSPGAPFTTSTLQQAASSNLGFTPKRTMQVAQKLYEHGHITYMRTDSNFVVPAEVNNARTYIKSEYGEKYLNANVKSYNNKKGQITQDAHEAIRPTDVKKVPEKLPKTLGERAHKLYDLIWSRTVASQMSEAVYLNSKALIVSKDKKYTFEANGSILKFDGYTKVYKSKREDVILPDISEGNLMKLDKVDTEEKVMSPPPRYTESSLVKELEKFNIGRPSTYASIISVIQSRGYVKNINKSLHPTDNGIVVNKLLVEHFPEIVDVDFTAQMEESLDKIAGGNVDWKKMIKDFYGPFSKNLAKKTKEINKEDYVNIEQTNQECPECKEGKLMIKLGRYGKFYSCNRFPDCKYAKPIETELDEDEMTEEEIENNNELQQKISKPCPECNGQLTIKQGRFGKFIACKNYPKCKYTEAILNKIGVKCPKCSQGDVIFRRSKRGKGFYGCSRYPDCDYTSWTKPGNENDEEQNRK